MRSSQIGKLGECSDANAGSRALCPNIQPKSIWLIVRHDFQVLTHFIIIDYFYVEKMYYRFPPIALKLSLQKWYGAKKFLHVRSLIPKSDHWPVFVLTFCLFTIT